jgi:hypothetical protein
MKTSSVHLYMTDKTDKLIYLYREISILKKSFMYLINLNLKHDSIYTFLPIFKHGFTYSIKTLKISVSILYKVLLSFVIVMEN